MNSVNARSTFICENYIFSSDFDSGNLLKVELLRKNSKYSSAQCVKSVKL